MDIIWQVGIGNTSTAISHPIGSSNCKTGDSVSTHQQVNSKCEVENDDATMSLLVRLTSLQQETNSDEQNTSDNCHPQVQPAAAEYKNVPFWLHQQMNSSKVTLSIPSSSNTAVPDLELTLAAPKAKTLEQNKSSPGSFLLGPISVT